MVNKIVTVDGEVIGYKGKPMRSIKERYNYHKAIAETGKKPDGKTVGVTSRVYHANKANELQVQQNKFMKGAAWGGKVKFVPKKKKNK